MKRPVLTLIYKALFFIAIVLPSAVSAQINTDQVIRVGQNAMYFEDYVLSIQYFNQAIRSKPYLAQPYFYRAVAKYNLEDYAGAEADASMAISINPYLADAWEVRGVARQNLGRSSDAISDYREALKALPRNRQIMFNLAMAYGSDKQYTQADSTFSLLIQYYPGFDNAYLGRAMVKMETADTVAALADVDKAIDLNPHSLNAQLMRADIAVNFEKDKSKAIAALDNAIRLEPKKANLYINRANLRHDSDDYFGAMADYDYALQLDPLNHAALFNRALLRTEVADYDNALTDYNHILKIDPNNDLALYNRAVIYSEKGDYSRAIADIDVLIKQYPDLGAPYFMRSEWRKAMGDMQRAKSDYEKGESLVSTNRPVKYVTMRKNVFDLTDSQNKEETKEVSQEEFAERFNQLLTVDDGARFEEEYNNSSIRGKVQDRNLNIEIEPLLELAFYSSPNELKSKAYYIKEVDDLNATRILRNQLVVTNRVPQLNDEALINRHFSSIDYYNSYLATHTPRSIDYIGRALDFITVKNYPQAIEDLGRAISLTPDHPIAYLLRAQARYHNNDDTPRNVALNLILADLDRTIQLSPRNAVAWFDKGNVLFHQGDLDSAISAYTRAIELESEMGEAYYNRGYIHLKLGNQAKGIEDLSKAGELGIVGAYNLIKRLTN